MICIAKKNDGSDTHDKWAADGLPDDEVTVMACEFCGKWYPLPDDKHFGFCIYDNKYTEQDVHEECDGFDGDMKEVREVWQC